MNTDGHERLAELVNDALPNAMPLAALRTGAIDPDTKQSGYHYTGILSKHHFDAQGLGSHRYHGSDTIIQIVVSFCANARRYWLVGAQGDAAFAFGVASHYLVDGFICSPSVNEEIHATGDREFAHAARHLVPGNVPAPDDRRFGNRFLEEEVRADSGCFGRTNPADLAVAYRTLVELGEAITASIVPPELQQRSASAQRVLDERLKADAAAFAKYSSDVELNRDRQINAHAAAGLDHSRMAWFFVGIAQYCRRGVFKWRWLSMGIAALFQRRVAKQYLRPLKEALGKCFTDMKTSTSHSSQLTIEWDRQWFRMDGFLANHAQQCSRQLEAQTRQSDAVLDSQRSGADKSIATWDERWLDEKFPRRWANSFPDTVGHSRKTMLALCVAFMVSAAALGGLVFTIGSHIAAGAIGGSMLLLGLCTWRAWRTCARICQQVWHTGEIICPKCHRRSLIEALRWETSATCPACDHQDVPILNASMSEEAVVSKG